MGLNIFDKQLGNLKRVKCIVAVLTKQGFGYLVENSSLKRYIPFKEKLKLGKPKEQKTSASVRLRLVLEELGPTFVKFGQLLSTRQDIIPEDMIIELSKLQDKVPAFSYKQVRGQVEKELGKSINQVFSSFNKEPIASASIGQVHEARLKNGKRVAVKIQRINIEKTIDEDLDILTFFAEFLDEHVSNLRVYNLKGLVEEFKRTIKKELNYEIEANNISIFYQNLSHFLQISIR